MSSAAAGLNRRFDEIAGLDHVLVFIDEVEEIAGTRSGADATAVGVVNELLKAIVRFRGQDGRLLVCATNDVTTLDSAFLRHGRFDYVLPIGPPDDRARTALWESFSQVQFEHTFDTGTRARPTTEDYLRTIGETRPTVSAAMAQAFARQTEKFARI
ncbi:AAA family ATPase [Streptomyces erythrochromogenes]|uniref:AAA family ATPase n=1 Tax=Streptomyces erythrochromogenes TaxID=285574 RepID=UPI003690E4A5